MKEEEINKQMGKILSELKEDVNAQINNLIKYPTSLKKV